MRNPESPVFRKREALEGLVPGKTVKCEVDYYDPRLGEMISYSLGDRIKSVHSGGFYGDVLTLDNSELVIKLTQPPAKHDFLRYINWQGLFPPQTSRWAATHDHLTSRIISRILPLVTDGPPVFAPQSYGFTHFPGLGYAQVLERVNGRPARFDVNRDEVGFIKNVQGQLLETLTEFGLEQVGQIHPGNPLAFENLWLGNDGRTWMLDTLPAIPHTGFVLPGFWFRFHGDIQRRLKTGELTFNRIHTDRFRSALKSRSLSPELLTILESELDYYDQVSHQMKQAGRQSFLDGCLESGLITEEQKQRLAALPVDQFLLKIGLASEPLFRFVSDSFFDFRPVRFFGDREFRADALGKLKQLFKDPGYREKFFLEKFALAGIIEANQQGILSDAELMEARAIIQQHELSKEEQEKRLAAYLTMSASFFATSQFFNFLEASCYAGAFFVDNPEAAVALGLFLGWVLPGASRAMMTWAIGKGYGVDLKLAAGFSAFPKFGSILAIPADLTISRSMQSNVVWHYTLRRVVARASKLMSFWGGWGSQHEAELWKLLPELIKNMPKEIESDKMISQ